MQNAEGHNSIHIIEVLKNFECHLSSKTTDTHDRFLCRYIQVVPNNKCMNAAEYTFCSVWKFWWLLLAVPSSPICMQISFIQFEMVVLAPTLFLQSIFGLSAVFLSSAPSPVVCRCGGARWLHIVVTLLLFGLQRQTLFPYRLCRSHWQLSFDCLLHALAHTKNQLVYPLHTPTVHYISVILVERNLFQSSIPCLIISSSAIWEEER